ncbi:putative frizzled-9-like [Apostichopus japonicus]|uniref:Putative frizzled-9-like n=1 Tax=Stichopus japonicus TaxID=307972 RepID=A0A2G8KYL3_STIJA|nr:putative frizzled-9-like [Apostichopus japonicus]
MEVCLLLLTMVIAVANSAGIDASRYGSNKCERIKIPMCVGIGYNTTRMPNVLGHTTQDEAAPLIHEFQPLVEYGCDEHLRFFLCSLFAPMCSPQVDVAIPACRPMCVKVRNNCEPVIEEFSFKWPTNMDCNQLPHKNKILCMNPPGLTDDGDTDGSSSAGGYGKNPVKDPPHVTKAPNISTGASMCGNPDRFIYLPQTKECAQRCVNDVLYRRGDKDFAELWISVWSILCLVFTSLTIFTFLIDRSRFHYPERPIVFLSMCYNMYSIAFIIRLAAGPYSIACESTADNELYLIQRGLESTLCTIVFLIQYYFYMASSIWWMILTVTWFLAAGMKWGYEAIAAYSSYYHFAAWALPAGKTIIVLLMRRMDGDELTGMCFVGNQDPVSLGWFVIAPLFVYYTVGTIFIILGFIYLFHIRKVMKNGGTNIDKLEKFMVRIGVFSAMYLIPATTVIACLFYQRSKIIEWREAALNSEPCPPGHQGPCRIDQSIPSSAVMLIKIFMFLVVGITSGMWIWSTKTVNSWQSCLTRLTGTRPPRKQCQTNGRTLSGSGVHCPQRTHQYLYTSTKTKSPSVV